MGVDIPWPEMVKEQFFDGQNRIPWASAKIDNHRDVPRQSTGFYCPVYRSPFVGFIMGYLKPHDIIPVSPCYHCGKLCIHITGILLVSAAPHTFPHDIEKRQDPGPGPIDHILFENAKVFPTSTSTIDDGGDPHPESKSIGREGGKTVAQVLVRLGAKKIMPVNVDDARRDIHPLGIDYLSSFFWINIFGNSCYFSIIYGDIHNPVNIVFGINQMPSFDHQIISLGSQRPRYE